MRIALAIFISALALAAQADGIYKWTDENGVVHFGSQPPQAKQQEEDDVEVVRKPKSKRYKQWQAEQEALKAEKQAAEGNREEETAEDEPADPEQQPQQDEALSRAEQAVRAQRCRMARENLQELTNHSRVREVGADGQMRVLPEEERQQRIAQMKQTIRDNC
ncbi:DUF4124 domain-containing protein [Microbulbifer halophilus]|uniref:DUF4124 domain-containing protein n=1 Tax=Microbulbifer halophilus TaxID=453963 RepID=A0ABW5E5B3_9GAMM|nr:DUF4124 domain-containing protein [Microbulbifer halophilus]MCW8127509.1 DUF4124 domain-containing protein [Microbulbifer halophilus]